MGEDDVFVLESIAEAKKNEEDKLRVTLILSLKDSMPALTKVLKIIEVSSTYACTLQLLLGFHKVVCSSDVSSPSLGPPARPSEGIFARLEPARSPKT